jgi:hypothetical protein
MGIGRKCMSKENKSDKDSSRVGVDSPADYDFRHYLHDTIVLLGGKKQVADLLVKSQDGHVKETDVKEVRKYNGALIDETKDRLANVHKVKVRPKSK